VADSIMVSARLGASLRSNFAPLTECLDVHIRLWTCTNNVNIQTLVL